MRIEVKHDGDWLRLVRASERFEEVGEEGGERSNDGLVSAQSHTPAVGSGQVSKWTKSSDEYICPFLNDWISQKHQNLQEKMTSEEVVL